MNRNFKRVGMSALSIALSASLVQIPVYAEEKDDHPTEKTETVYVVLNSDGSVDNTIVSSWLHDEDGIHNVQEKLSLKNVKNIKGDEEPKVNGDTYTWDSDSTDLYYQGNSNEKIPVSVSVKYELDGKEMTPDKLEGKSGHIKMTVSFKNNETVKKVIDGKEVNIHPSYLAAGLLTLDTSVYSNVKCLQGEITSDGSNEMLVFATIPGLAETIESLGLERVNEAIDLSDEVEIEADVKDFSAANIMMAMTNEFNLNTISNVDSVSELTSGVDQLMDGAQQLLDGSKELYDGTTTLKTEASPLTSAYPQIRQLADATDDLSSGTSLLKDSTITYTQGVAMLNQGNQSLYGITNGISQVKAGVSTSTSQQTSLVDGTAALENGLRQLNSQVGSLNTDELMQSLSQSISATKRQLNTLNTILENSKSSLAALQSDLTSAKQSLATLQTTIGQLQQVLSGIDQIVSADNQMIASDQAKIDDINAKIDEINAQIESVNSAKTAEYNSITTTISALNSAKASLDDTSDPDGTQRAAIDSQVATLSAQQAAIDTTAISQFSHIDSLSQLQTLTTLETQLNAIVTGINSELNNPESTLNQSMADTVKQLGLMNTYLHGENGDDTESGAFYTIGVLETILSRTNSSLNNMGLSADDINALKNGVAQLYEGSKQLSIGAQTLNAGLETLYNQSLDGINQINAGSSQLVSYNDALVDGVTQLDDGAQELHSKKDMFYEMADGLQSLGEAFETLNEGAKALYEGNETFSEEGMKQLAEKVDLGVEEARLLKDVFNTIIEVNESYTSYSGSPEGAECKTRYILRTAQ